MEESMKRAGDSGLKYPHQCGLAAFIHKNVLSFCGKSSGM